MPQGYRAVFWNRQKLIYDVVLLLAVALYLGAFLLLTPLFDSNAEPTNVAIRAFGSAAFILLHVILSIGPLCRLEPRFLPLLYNRRHMGVVMCLLALYHARLSLAWYHGDGSLEPLVSLLVSNTQITSFVHFPFEWLGLGALIILVFMAATSHDFWLAQLTAPVWKALHMGVYAAYALLVGHVTLGALQTNSGFGLALLVGLGLSWIVGVHLLAALRETSADRSGSVATDGWIDAGPVDEIPESRAKVIFGAGERIAVFRYGDKLSALSGVCQHQNGPLGEGKVVAGLVTCPWHGYQYDPATGAAPSPFEERIPTFDVRVRAGRVFVNPSPHPPGTRVEPARIGAGESP